MEWKIHAKAFHLTFFYLASLGYYQQNIPKERAICMDYWHEIQVLTLAYSHMTGMT
jgi:hypothetical protein